MLINALFGTIVAQNQNYKNIKHSMKDNSQYEIWSKFLEDYKEYYLTIDEKWDSTHCHREVLVICVSLVFRQLVKNALSLTIFYIPELIDYHKITQEMFIELRI